MDVFIDTAVKGCNVALFTSGQIIAIGNEPIERGHAETLLPLYQSLLKDSKYTSNDIKNVYTTIGPGSFTGLRVGMTAARMMGFSLNIPVHGLTTFQAFSAGIEGAQDRLVVIETKRSDYYCQILTSNHQPKTDPMSLSANDIKDLLVDNPNTIVTGDAVNRLSTEIEEGCETQFHQEMISVDQVIQSIQYDQLSYQTADPLYIRDADVSQPK